ncbi:MAG: hypothetical protein ACR5LF_11100 [Symbiopectobacterium sp.]
MMLTCCTLGQPQAIKMHKPLAWRGMAFSTTGLELVHNLAHALDGVFHITHGKINAMLLPLLIRLQRSHRQ